MILSRFFRHQDIRLAVRRHDKSRRFLLEPLEGRQLLSTFTVTNVNDTGAGSLRAAITSSNATTGSTVNSIGFDIGSGGSETISLKSGLPAITHPVFIDGTTQPGTGKTPLIVLSGSNAGNNTTGLNLEASNSTVKGLVIDSFGGTGVLITGAPYDTITDDYIGVTATGNVPAGNGYDGVHLTSGAQDDVVSDDVISANGGHGVDIDGGSHNNTVEGSMIGTNSTGTKPLGNKDSGVYIENKSNSNVIGGTAAGTGNVLSGNMLRGVHIDSGSSKNVVEGNVIGTDSTGTKPLGNSDSGVLITDGADDNVVGGTTAATLNVISANGARGVNIDGSSGNLVEGNVIGTDLSGTKPLGNSDSGVLIDNGASDNLVGGTTPAARNVISANGYRGVHIDGSSGNLVEGNVIGTDVSGTKPLGNIDSGVLVDDGSSDNVIGGTATGSGNTISFNAQNGVHIDDGSDGNLIEGDTIDNNASNGVDIDCSSSITVSNCRIGSNEGYGILVTGSSEYMFTNNTLSHNGLGGVKD